MNSDRGASQLQFDFGDEAETKPLAKLLRQEPTDPAHVDQPSLSASPVDALMEQVVDTANLERAWRQVNVDGMSVALPDHLLNLLRGSVGGTAGAKPETRFRETRVEDRRQDLTNGLLNETVNYVWDTE